MITEKDISKHLGRSIHSPIRMGSVNELGLNIKEFIAFFKPYFETLQDDVYLTREKQISFLKKAFPEDLIALNELHQPFFKGKLGLASLSPWIKKFTSAQQEEFTLLSTITRQRNISSFIIEIWDNTFFVERTSNTGFEQNVGDFRSWERTFAQATKSCVENELFFKLLKGVSKLVSDLHPKARKIQITSHFMRTISREKIKGENAPEGVHEDGAQYIVSALVIDRKNIAGAESQIYEQTTSGQNELIFQKELQVGEFIFQADTGEEFTFGNDLWHYVTPIEPLDNADTGIRDIIGFDIDILS